MRRARLRAVAVACAGLTALVSSGTSSGSALPTIQEPGFVVTPYAQTGGTPSSLAFGPDTRTGEEGQRLYVVDNAAGTLLVIDDTGGAGSAPAVFADGFRGPL